MQNNKSIENILPGYSEATEKAIGLSDPQPDWTFGIKQGPFPDPKNRRLPKKVASLLGLCLGTHHPFLIIETKPAEEGVGPAENQALHNGSRIANAHRQVDSVAKERVASMPHLSAIYSTPKKHSFAFSCFWNPDLAKVFVNWCLTEVFHINRVVDYLMSREEGLSKLRLDPHNIIDWGALTNGQAAEEVVYGNQGQNCFSIGRVWRARLIPYLLRGMQSPVATQ